MSSHSPSVFFPEPRMVITGKMREKTVHLSPTSKAFLSGALSGTCSTLMFQPFDLIKTRIQSGSTLVSNGPKGVHPPSGMIPIVVSLVRSDNVFALWRGTSVSLARTVPGVGLYFMSLDFLKTQWGSQSLTPLEAATMGLTARSIAGFILLPVTVMKTRFESGLYNYDSLSHALRETYAKEGVRGLFRGCIPTLMRDAPYSGLYFMFYSQLKSWSSLNGSSPLASSSASSSSSSSSSTPTPSPSTKPVTTFVCGLSAGLLASLITHPFDVVKTRIQLNPSGCTTSYGAAIIIFRDKGVNGFLAGVTPRIMRRSLMSAISWTIFESLTKSFGLK